MFVRSRESSASSETLGCEPSQKESWGRSVLSFDPDRLHSYQPLNLKGFQLSWFLAAGKALHGSFYMFALYVRPLLPRERPLSTLVQE